MPKNLTPQDQWETQFEVPLPGEPRNIGPLETLFQRLLNRTERLRSRIGDLLGLPWDSTPPDTLAGLHQRVGTLEAAQGGTTLQAHRSAPVLDHPDGSITLAKLAATALGQPGALATLDNQGRLLQPANLRAVYAINEQLTSVSGVTEWEPLSVNVPESGLYLVLASFSITSMPEPSQARVNLQHPSQLALHTIWVQTVASVYGDVNLYTLTSLVQANSGDQVRLRFSDLNTARSYYLGTRRAYMAAIRIG